MAAAGEVCPLFAFARTVRFKQPKSRISENYPCGVKKTCFSSVSVSFILQRKALHVGTKHYLFSGAPNGSAPQNICYSSKFLLAGRFGRNNMSLEEKCCWEKANSGELRGLI